MYSAVYMDLTPFTFLTKEGEHPHHQCNIQEMFLQNVPFREKKNTSVTISGRRF